MFYRVLPLFLLLILSCSKEVDLFQQEKDKILGRWQIESLREQFFSGNLLSSTSDAFEAEFQGDEVVTFIYPDRPGFEQMKIWYYQLRPERVIIVATESSVGQFLLPNEYYTIVEKSENRQVWEFKTVEGDNATSVTWTLTKAN